MFMNERSLSSIAHLILIFLSPNNKKPGCGADARVCVCVMATRFPNITAIPPHLTARMTPSRLGWGPIKPQVAYGPMQGRIGWLHCYSQCFYSKIK